VPGTFLKRGTVGMGEKTNRRQMAVRYLVAGILFLIVGIRFFYMDDQIGTVIYGAATLFCLLAACVHYVKKE
jgi:hypothetical protein